MASHLVFGRMAEIAGEYLKKGSQVYVEGSLRTRKSQDKEGKDRQTTEIRADTLQMLGSREGERMQGKPPTKKPLEGDPWEAESASRPDPFGLVGPRDEGPYPF